MTLQFELRRAQHAIGEFTATLQFFNPISPAGFINVLTALNAKANELNLPAPMPINVFQIAIGQPFPLSPAFSQNPAGAGYQRFASNGEIAESLMCDSASITYSLREYTTWEDVKPRLVEVMSSIATAYIVEVPAIQSIRLQYLNEFRALEASTESASEIFLEDSKWVPAFHHKQKDAWHSHIGAYVPISDIQRNLINVNCDIASSPLPHKQGVYRTANVLILAGCYYNIPGMSPLVIDENILSTIVDEKFDEAHTLERDVLRQVISAPYLMAMGAN